MKEKCNYNRDLGEGGLLGGMTMGIWRTSGVDRIVGTRVALESSP